MEPNRTTITGPNVPERIHADIQNFNLAYPPTAAQFQHVFTVIVTIGRNLERFIWVGWVFLPHFRLVTNQVIVAGHHIPSTLVGVEFHFDVHFLLNFLFNAVKIFVVELADVHQCVVDSVLGLLPPSVKVESVILHRELFAGRIILLCTLGHLVEVPFTTFSGGFNHQDTIGWHSRKRTGHNLIGFQWVAGADFTELRNV